MNSRQTSTRHFFFAAALLVAVLLVPSLADACPGCKENLPDGASDTATVAQGYAWAIYLMLGVMITLLGTMGGAAFFILRKAAKRGQL
ncbi:MAG: hypothetical protein WD768_11265 [Phycisphaeraceae bacterium]